MKIELKMTLLIEIQHIGALSWYQLLLRASHICFDQHENFVKASYRNRCKIASPNGVLELSVPLANGRSHRRRTKEVKISYDHEWQKLHWHSLCSAYRRSPYFEYYEDDLLPMYQKKHDYLIDLNLEWLQIFIDWLSLDISFDLSDKYIPAGTENIDDRRSHIHPNARKQIFPADFQSPNYHQVFMDKTGFIKDMSLFDLMFNLGPSGIELLKVQSHV